MLFTWLEVVGVHSHTCENVLKTSITFCYSLKLVIIGVDTLPKYSGQLVKNMVFNCQKKKNAKHGM